MPPKIVSPEEWRTARLNLLKKEEAHFRDYDVLAEEQRALPMVPVVESYTFESTSGPISLRELFGTKSQLIVYNFMFEPTADEGCHGCSCLAVNFPNLRHLAEKDTAFFVVSQAPISKITSFKERNKWTFPWVSSHASQFNYDFHATLDEKVTPVEYNVMNKEELVARGWDVNTTGEQAVLSVFKLQDGTVYHTYSAYRRGLDALHMSFTYLDLTPAGRQVGANGAPDFMLPFEYDEEN